MTIVFTWKTARIFISSTFRDMQAERDHLVRFVFPRLREHLLSRRIHLVDVDLRWGVTSEQDASEVCREIIDECRPRFLCMLGGRYGWTPPGKSHSITADEVRYGVLDQRSKDRGFAYFYFRDEAATAAMVETAPGEFRESRGSKNQKKLAQLKQAIVDAGLNPFPYPAQWDNESRRLTGLKQFGDRVYDDLLAGMKSDPDLRDRFLTDGTAKLDEFDEENAAMEAFVEERSERFVLGSREAVLGELLAHAVAIGGNGYLCLTGAPGSGKSALLAQLSRYSSLNDQNSILLIRHFVGASPGSTDVRRTLRRLCRELKVGCPEITAKIPDDPEKLRLAFPDFLRQACARRRVVILLDAVNQLDPATYSAGLQWLPEELPDNARAILSALEGPALEELRRRHRLREIELKPLTADDGEAIIEQFRQRYRKKFEPDQRTALLDKTEAGMPLYLLAALEELRTLGTYEEISGRIDELPPTTQELFAWILERLENDDGFRDASEHRVGCELVSRFAALLGASRYGLSQRELADLLDASDQQGNVAALLHLLRPYLMHRGELLNFYHTQLKHAVEGRYLSDEADRRTAHLAIANYFLAQSDLHTPPPNKQQSDAVEDQQRPAPNRRKFEELPWQFATLRAWSQLHSVLADPNSFSLLWEIDSFDARRYWTEMEANSGFRATDTYCKLLEEPNPDYGITLAVGELLSGFGAYREVIRLWQHLAASASVKKQTPLIAIALGYAGLALHMLGNTQAAGQLLAKVTDYWRDIGQRLALQIALGNQAINLTARGLYEEALALHKEEEAICREDHLRDGLQTCLGNQGVIFLERGEYHLALEVFKEQESLCHGNLEGRQRSLCNQALAHYHLGDYDRALAMLDEQQKLCHLLGYVYGLQVGLGVKAKILLAKKDAFTALVYAKERVKLCRDCELPDGLINALMDEAEIYSTGLSDLPSAHQCLGEALAIAESKGLERSSYSVQQQIGRL